MRCLLSAVTALAVLLAGCGDTQSAPPISREQHERLALEQWDLMAKGKANREENEKLLQRYGLTREQFAQCAELYGEPDPVRAKRLAIAENLIKGVKPPPPPPE